MATCERWKSIDGHPNYQVSSYGRVRHTMNGEQKPQWHTRGYLKVNLYVYGVCYSRTVHRLVAEAFIPNPDNLPIVHHRDFNRRNNNVDNLEWATHQENSSRRKPNNRLGIKASHWSNSALVERMQALGLNGRQLARRSGVSEHSIYRALAGHKLNNLTIMRKIAAACESELFDVFPHILDPVCQHRERATA